LEPTFHQYREVASLANRCNGSIPTFPRQQVKVIFYDDFKSNPGAVYADILNFLGIDHDGRKYFPVVNSNMHHRVHWVGKFLHTKPDGLIQTANAVKKVLRLKTLGVGKLARKVDAVAR